jgi:hypothetical protein
MSEPNQFSYDGHVVLNVSVPQNYQCITQTASTNVPKPVGQIKILHLEHLIPINVICELDGNETVLTAYIDYTTNNVHLPQETITELCGAEDLFRATLVDFIANKNAEATQLYEEMYPPVIAEERYTIPVIPYTDEDDY